MKADLHCHTTCSDSSVTPEMLVTLAREQGISAVAITDHDTLEGVDRAVAAGKKCGVSVIPGVEISSKDPETGRRIHILCYAPKKPEEIRKICDPICDSRRAAAEKMIRLVREKYPVPEELIRYHARNGSVIFKQHIMHALWECGYCAQMEGVLRKELFRSKGGSAYVPVTYPTVDEALEAAHRAEAFVVLAHPFEYDSIDRLRRMLAERAIDGIEGYHSRCTAEQSAFLLQLARQYQVAVTGGSDFHGYYSSRQIQLGSVPVPEETVRLLLDRING